MTQRPIFVVGTMRSGSTLFRLVLDSHPNIAMSEETGFMGALAATKTIPGWYHGHGWYGRLGWSEDEFHGHLREFYATMFERYACRQGKSRWGEKTPFHSRHMPLMADIFPNAVFVAITRHPAAVVHSLQKFHYDAGEAATYWSSTNAEILRHGSALGSDRFALVRYEDLVLHPEPLLRELTEWLGEPWSEDVLRHNEIQAEKAAPRISAGNTRTRDPIRSHLDERWAAVLSAAERAEMVSHTAALAEFLGYDPARTGEPEPLTPVGPGSGPSMLITGDALAERMRARGQRFDVPSAEEIAHPEMDVAELAARLRQAERALARIRSRRTIRWTDAAQRAARGVSGVPTEVRAWARRRVRPARGR